VNGFFIILCFILAEKLILLLFLFYLPPPKWFVCYVYRLKEKGVLVGAEGYDNNTLSFIPPLCISTNDVDYILKVLEKILLEIAIDQDVSSFLERLESG